MDSQQEHNGIYNSMKFNSDIAKNISISLIHKKICIFWAWLSYKKELIFSIKNDFCVDNFDFLKILSEIRTSCCDYSSLFYFTVSSFSFILYQEMTFSFTSFFLVSFCWMSAWNGRTKKKKIFFGSICFCHYRVGKIDRR